MLSDNNKIAHRKKMLVSFLLFTGMFAFLFGRPIMMGWYTCVSGRRNTTPQWLPICMSGSAVLRLQEGVF